MTVPLADDFTSIGRRMREIQAEEKRPVEPSGVQTTAGVELDQLAIRFGGIRRPGESDASLRERVAWLMAEAVRQASL